MKSSVVRTPSIKREKSPLSTHQPNDPVFDPAVLKELNAILGSEHGGDNPNPFIPAIRDYQYPKDFKMPDEIPEYNGTTDP